MASGCLSECERERSRERRKMRVRPRENGKDLRGIFHNSPFTNPKKQKHLFVRL